VGILKTHIFYSPVCPEYYSTKFATFQWGIHVLASTYLCEYYIARMDMLTLHVLPFIDILQHRVTILSQVCHLYTV